MANTTHTLPTRPQASAPVVTPANFHPNSMARKIKGAIFAALGVLSLGIVLGALAVLLIDVWRDGRPWLDRQFLTSFDSRFARQAGIKAALYGTVWMMVFTIAISLPLGVASAIYLEEYAPRNWWTRLLQTNIANLAGVPSVVYGLLGLGLFAEWLRLGRSIISGALTMALLILPIIIIASQEAIRAVPPSLRQAAFALGATKWQVARHHVLPVAMPGILTGTILALSRAIGETAPLLVVGAAAYVTFNPDSLSDKFTVLPMQIYEWTRRPQEEFQELASAAIIVLLVVLLLMNAAAIVLRQRFSRKVRW